MKAWKVKAPGGWAVQSDPYRGASKLAGRSRCVNQEAPKYVPRVKRIAGETGVPSRSDLGEGHVGIEVLDHNDDRTPRGHRGWHVRKECAVKARNHLWVASALPHSEGIAYKPLAVKSRCARRWGGWGRLSLDGPRQHNSDQNEDLWGGGPPTLQGGARSSPRPDTARESRRTTTCTNGGRKPNISQCMPGAALAG